MALGAGVAYRAFDNWWNTKERLTALVNDRALIGLDIADAERLIRNTRPFFNDSGDRVYYFRTIGLLEVEMTLAVGDTGVVYARVCAETDGLLAVCNPCWPSTFLRKQP
ncbi:MAG: hypothetical protein IBJ10_07705 [Phycisphaerales bacterium]|nr:hypothetical protein [Phycisphaerales bacterium]